MSTLKANTIENVAGDKSVAVAGLSKIEDTGKNICTAWVSFDGATTPPTIKDSFNVSSIVRTATGRFTVNFAEVMDNTNYAISGYASQGNVVSTTIYSVKGYENNKTVNSCNVITLAANAYHNYDSISVVFFGGKD